MVLDKLAGLWRYKFGQIKPGLFAAVLVLVSSNANMLEMQLLLYSTPTPPDTATHSLFAIELALFAFVLKLGSMSSVLDICSMSSALNIRSMSSVLNIRCMSSVLKVLQHRCNIC